MNHYIKLPNGRFLVINYQENEVSIGSSYNGEEVSGYICQIGMSGTMVTPNAGEAVEAFVGLEPNDEAPPEYSHSQWE